MSDNLITEVKIWPLKKDHPKVKANASFLVAGMFRIKATVMKGPKGLYVSLPGRAGDKKDENGKPIWYDDVAPISAEARKLLTDAIIPAYNKETGGAEMNQGEAPGPTNQENVPF